MENQIQIAKNIKDTHQIITMMKYLHSLGVITIVRQSGKMSTHTPIRYTVIGIK